SKNLRTVWLYRQALRRKRAERDDRDGAAAASERCAPTVEGGTATFSGRSERSVGGISRLPDRCASGCRSHCPSICRIVSHLPPADGCLRPRIRADSSSQRDRTPTATGRTGKRNCVRLVYGPC